MRERAPPPRPAYEQGPGPEHQNSTGDAQPGDDGGRCGRSARHEQPQRGHSEGVRDGHRGGEGQDVPQGGAAPRGGGGGHQGLAVPRRDRVQCPQQQGDGQGESGEAGGEVVAVDEAGEGLRPPVRATRQHGSRRFRLLLAEGGPAGCDAQGGGVLAGRRVEQPLRVVTEPLRYGHLRHIRSPHGHPIPLGGDFPQPGTGWSGGRIEAGGELGGPGCRARTPRGGWAAPPARPG